MKLGPNKLMAAALALAVVVGIGALTVQFVKDAGDPAPAVREYLDAIAAGDATAANRMLDFETGEGERLEDAEGGLLSDAVLGSAVERIEVHRVETVERSEDRAVVRADLSLAGESFVHDFALKGTPGSLFTRDAWQVTSPLLGLMTLELPSETGMLPDGLAADLGGEKIPVEHSVFSLGEPLAAVAVYPAVYRISLDAGEYFKPQTAKVLVQPLNGESHDYLNSLLIESMFGSFDHPDAVLPLDPSEKFAESMIDSGLVLAQACAAEPGVFVRVQGETISCPLLTNLAAVDACLASPGARLGEYGGTKFFCEFYREITPFRGEIGVAPVASATATPDKDSDWLYRIGPYRFTDSQTGASFEASLYYAELEWIEGRPSVHGGSFTAEG